MTKPIPAAESCRSRVRKLTSGKAAWSFINLWYSFRIFQFFATRCHLLSCKSSIKIHAQCFSKTIHWLHLSAELQPLQCWATHFSSSPFYSPNRFGIWWSLLPSSCCPHPVQQEGALMKPTCSDFLLPLFPNPTCTDLYSNLFFSLSLGQGSTFKRQVTQRAHAKVKWRMLAGPKGFSFPYIFGEP